MNWEFSRDIIELRKQQGWSQEELAARLGISRQAIAKWESGQNYPDIMRLFEIADVFGISVRSLLPESRLYADKHAVLMESISSEYALIDYVNIDTGDILYEFYGQVMADKLNQAHSSDTSPVITNCFDPKLQELHNRVIAPNDLDRFLKCYNKEYIIEKLRSKNEFSIRYRLLCSDTPQYGQTTIRKTKNYDKTHNCIIMVKRVPDEIYNLDYKNICFNTICKKFNALYYADIKSDDFEYIQLGSELTDFVSDNSEQSFFGTLASCRTFIDAYREKYVLPAYYDVFMEKTDPEYIKSRLDIEESFSFTYQGYRGTLTKFFRMSAVRVGNDGERFIVWFENIDDIFGINLH